MKRPSEDRRAFERFSARFPIKIKDTREDYGTNVFLRNASAEGMKITSRERMFINDSISLSVKLPDGFEPLTLNGQVSWVRTKEQDLVWDIGVKFHKVNLMHIQRLFNFVHEEPRL